MFQYKYNENELQIWPALTEATWYGHQTAHLFQDWICTRSQVSYPIIEGAHLCMSISTII